MSETQLHKLCGDEGSALLYLHGFGADRLSWLASAPSLTGTVGWAADLPGHGTAGNDVGEGSIEDLARDLSQALQDLPGPVIVVGHSMGGAVALHLAALVPDLVRALVLIAPAGLGRELDSDFVNGFAELQDETQAMDLLKRLVVRERLIAPQMAQHTLSSLDESGRREALKKIGHALLNGSAPAWPPTQPVKVLWGGEDQINPLPVNATEQFGDALTVIAKTGHLPQVEAATKVNAVIREMLAELE